MLIKIRSLYLSVNLRQTPLVTKPLAKQQIMPATDKTIKQKSTAQTKTVILKTSVMVNDASDKTAKTNSINAALLITLLLVSQSFYNFYLAKVKYCLLPFALYYCAFY